METGNGMESCQPIRSENDGGYQNRHRNVLTDLCAIHFMHKWRGEGRSLRMGPDSWRFGAFVFGMLALTYHPR
jgi:hypothetical protein